MYHYKYAANYTVTFLTKEKNCCCVYFQYNEKNQLLVNYGFGINNVFKINVAGFDAPAFQCVNMFFRLH